MDIAEIESTLLKTIDSLAGKLPKEQLQDMRELVAAGESGVAFENLCTQVYEYDVALDATTLASLKAVGKALEVKPVYWDRLESGS